jgi:hypothetical protein
MAGDPPRELAEWRELVRDYDAPGSYTRLRDGAEAATTRRVWAKEGSQLHRVEPFARELEELPPVEVLRAPPRRRARTELYGLDARGRIVSVSLYDDDGDLWAETFLLHGTGEVTAVDFFNSDPPQRQTIRRWRPAEGRVEELIQATGPGLEGDDSRLIVGRYRYVGDRVVEIHETDTEVWSGLVTDQLITPSYAPDGELLRLDMRHLTEHDLRLTEHDPEHDPPCKEDSTVYEAPTRPPGDPDWQRAELADTVAEAVAAAVTRQGPPDVLYGLALQFSLGELHAEVSALFAQSRDRLLAEPEFEPVALWDPSWVDAEHLPRGVAAEWPDRAVPVPALEEPAVVGAFADYRRRAAAIDRDDGVAAIERLWGDIAARLTRRDWGGALEVTADFVALAYPPDPGEEDIRTALARTLPPDRLAEFETAGWIP